MFGRNMLRPNQNPGKQNCRGEIFFALNDNRRGPTGASVRSCRQGTCLRAGTRYVRNIRNGGLPGTQVFV